MFTRILVPLDGTPFAESALALATLLAERCGAEMLLVRAAHLAQEELIAGPPAKQTAAAYLRKVAEHLQAEGVQVRPVLTDDWPAYSILEQAEKQHADLIVMRTHGRIGLEALVHHSVTWQVFRESHTPILAWKLEQTPGAAEELPALPRFMLDPTAPILVPLDGSPLAERAIPVAREFAQLFGNPLLLVRVAEEPFLPGAGPDYPQELTRAEERVLTAAQQYLQAQQSELEGSGFKVDVDAALGIPVSYLSEIVKQRQVGLIVMAAHGRSGPGRLLLGSTARSLLSQVEPPVVLVRTELAQADRYSRKDRPFQEAVGPTRV